MSKEAAPKAKVGIKIDKDSNIVGIAGMSDASAFEVVSNASITSPEVAARISASLWGGPFSSSATLAPLTRAERVRLLMKEANAAAVEMVLDLDKSMVALLSQIEELEQTKTPINGVQSMVKELRPQVERWSGIVGGVVRKHGRSAG